VLPPFITAANAEQLPPDVVLADVRWYLDGRSGAAEYAAGHLPGAVFVDLDRWLAGHPANPRSGRHPLPRPEEFTEGLAELGIDDSDHVVAYDDAGGVIAARLVWMLRVTGRSAAVLSGGLQRWRAPLTTDVPHRRRTAPQVRPWPTDRLADIGDAARAADGSVLLLDARDRDRFSGAVEPVDPRPGHVPGAVNHPVREDLVEGAVAPADVLRARLLASGVRDGVDVVASCGSGVTACFLLLELEHAGFDGRLWPGSFSEWSNDCARPVATGF
jgi:thiosulfate/3-mercaptopyruvate sulfurtransferase